MIRTCKFKPCGMEFEPTDSRQEFCGPTCRANHHYAAHPEKGRSVPGDPLQSVATHPLREAREEHEATDLKSKLSQIIYQGIVDRLKYGPVHADDLEPLFNDEVRDVCRKLVGAQFGSLASRGYIVECERRKSKVKSRKGAKSGVYVLTAKGRAKLVGVGGGSEGVVSLSAASSAGHSSHSGEKPDNGTINPEGTAGSTAAGTLDRPDAFEIARGSLAGAGCQPIAVEDEASEAGRGGQSASASDASSEPTALFSEDVGRERPRSAFRDDEWGEAA